MVIRLISKYFLGSIPLIVALAAASSARAITLGQNDNFQDGGVAGWACCGTVTVANVPDAGALGVGDNALQAEFQQRFVFFNRTQWTGDYIAAGVARISMEVQNPNTFPLALRLGVAKEPFGPNGGGDTYVTSGSINVPNDNQWRRITFDIAPADFIPSFGNSSPTPNAAAALASVYELRILHNSETGDFKGASAPGTLLVNDILAEGPAPTEDADFDGDDDVDGEDFLIWQRGLGLGTSNATGDANGSGSVNGDDLAVWRAQFGMPPATPSAAATPEPGSAVLAVSTLAACTRARRRRQ